MIELDLPLLTHVGDEDSFSKTNNALGDPQLLRLPLEIGVRVIAAHVASSGTLNDDRLKGRLIYGTDYPLTNTPLVTPWQDAMNLTLRQLWQLGRTRNSWDRDVALKSALGVSPKRSV